MLQIKKRKKKQLNDELVDLKKEIKEAAKESQIYRIAIKIKFLFEFISGVKLEYDIEKYDEEILALEISKFKKHIFLL